MLHLTALDCTGLIVAGLALVAAVFFFGGRAWERAGFPAAPADDAAADAMIGWVHEVGAAAPAAPPLALVPPLMPPPAPRAPVPPPGPVRSYSALAAWRLQQETTQGADTSVTKLTAFIVDGMMFRDGIDQRAAGILAQSRRMLRGDQAA